MEGTVDHRIEALKKALEGKNGCETAQEAHELVSSTISSLELRGKDGLWVIPPLTSKSVREYGKGGYALRLIGHRIYFNQNGAFGIYVITEKIEQIYAKSSSDGVPFQEVARYHMPI